MGRFKILDGALDYLSFGDTATDVTLPANTPLRKFQEYRNKERKVEYERKPNSLPEALLETAVHPFYENFDESGFLIVPLSQRTKNNGAMTPLIAKANHPENTSNAAAGTKRFKPAKCTVTIPNAANNDANAVSQLTGIKYDKKGTSSYTFPYGASQAKSRENDVRADIKAAASPELNYNFQFTSEKY